MGLFDFLAQTVPCPACGDRRARRSLFGKIKCPNGSCEHFDADLMYKIEEAKQLAALRPAATGATQAAPLVGDYHPTDYRIEIQYTNFADEQKVFVGDWRTLRRRGRHYSLRVAPTGRRIALAMDRIGNLDEVQAAAARCPDPTERRILGYHARHGTTSERCEQVRRKYPDWTPEDQ